MESDINFRPLVSVIIPSFNRATLIGETLDSVLAQTYSNWECIIVDDGSTDGTQGIIQGYIDKDSRFKFFQRDREPKGASTCRNIGLYKSIGEYVIFFDSDDILLPHALFARLNAINECNEADLWVSKGGSFVVKEFQNNRIQEKEVNWTCNLSDVSFASFMLPDPRKPLWNTPSVTWKKSVINKLKWNQNAIIWQDIDLHLRALDSGIQVQLINNFDFSCRIDSQDDTRISKKRYSYHKLSAKINIALDIISNINSNNIRWMKKVIRIEIFNGLSYSVLNDKNFSSLQVRQIYRELDEKVGCKYKSFYITFFTFLNWVKKNNIPYLRGAVMIFSKKIIYRIVSKYE